MDVVKGQEMYQCELAASYCYEYHCRCKLWRRRYSSEINRSEVMNVSVKRFHLINGTVTGWGSGFMCRRVRVAKLK